jgi:integrative and conjugative element protein (TIGR02256 family)
VSVTISIPRPLLEGMFDECERFREEETGGALIGFYSWNGTDLHVDVRAVIGAGPNARRSAVSFFKDGEYQERMFREVEKRHPAIRHLGNWHTHHCNGLRTLSQGDCETYRKNVNSPNHAQDFWYALLITHGTPNEQMRYAAKHFIFVRHGKDFYEVPQSGITIRDSGVLAL